jgi:hypothetical protein
MVQKMRNGRKAGYVARGFTQCEGIDYHETFSSTAKMTSVRMAMHLVAQYDLSVSQLDVKTAFLNAPVDCELYLKQPEGYSNSDFVWRLKKSIYGLKQNGEIGITCYMPIFLKLDFCNLKLNLVCIPGWMSILLQ